MQNPQGQKNKFKTALIVSTVLLLLLSNFVTGLVVYFLTREKPSDFSSPVIYTHEEIFKRFAPSVCSISAGSEAGTGFLAKSADLNGARLLYIATNHHVVKDLVGAASARVSVQFYLDPADRYDNAEVTLMAYDIYHDIAVLRVEDKLPEKTRTAALNSINENPLAAQELVAIGNMGNAGIAAFNGAVSHVDKVLDFGEEVSQVLRYRPVYQVSADLNAGVSGGPIFDLRGSLVGLAAYQMPQEGGRPIVGVSFAVPACIAVPLIEKAVLAETTGEPIHKIDVYMESVTELYFSDLRFSITKTDGYIVNRVEGESAPPRDLEDGWFLAGDRLVSIAGNLDEKLTIPQIFGFLNTFVNESADEVPEALKARYTGEILTFTVLRGEEIKKIAYTKKKQLAL